MTVAIIGTGKIGGALARHLTAGGEQVVLAAGDESEAAALAEQLGGLATAASVKEQAAATIERLITASGFDPVNIGGVAESGRIEVPGGDLHQNGGLGGRLLAADEARAAVTAAA